MWFAALAGLTFVRASNVCNSVDCMTVPADAECAERVGCAWFGDRCLEQSLATVMAGAAETCRTGTEKSCSDTCRWHAGEQRCEFDAVRFLIGNSTDSAMYRLMVSRNEGSAGSLFVEDEVLPGEDITLMKSIASCENITKPSQSDPDHSLDGFEDCVKLEHCHWSKTGCGPNATLLSKAWGCIKEKSLKEVEYALDQDEEEKQDVFDERPPDQDTAEEEEEEEVEEDGYRPSSEPHGRLRGRQNAHLTTTTQPGDSVNKSAEVRRLLGQRSETADMTELMFWAVAGCPRKWAAPAARMRVHTRAHGVACCSFDGAQCRTWVPQCQPYGSYNDALAACSAYGWRMCTKTEVESNICCNMGCSLNTELVWTTTPSEMKWAAPGCSSHFLAPRLPKAVPPWETSNVRCCSIPSSGVATTCVSQIMGQCISSATYEQAETACASIGMQLCTKDQIDSDLCCDSTDTGCSLDFQLVWTANTVNMYWGIAGCPTGWGAPVPMVLHDMDRGGVRCCTSNGQYCRSRDPNTWQCGWWVKWSDADAFCNNMGWGRRMCTWAELRTSVCCNRGCQLDRQSIWTSDAVELFNAVTTTTTTTTITTTTMSVDSWFYTVAGCPADANAPAAVPQQKDFRAGAVCCFDGGPWCRHANNPVCQRQLTYGEALYHCMIIGGYPCTREQLEFQQCCDKQCGYDTTLVWSSTQARIWTVAGCGTNSLPAPVSRLPSETANVRCCSTDTGSLTCTSKTFDGNGAVVVDCLRGATYQQAISHCTSMNMRLCTRTELETATCCGARCDMDSDLVWTSTDAYATVTSTTTPVSRYFVVAGCPSGQVGPNRVSVRTSTERAGVRCCTQDGNWCRSRRMNWNIDCRTAATYQEAEFMCERLGRVLCTDAELDADTCCDSSDDGCGLDTQLVWTRTEVPSVGMIACSNPSTPTVTLAPWESAAVMCCSNDGLSCVATNGPQPSSCLTAATFFEAETHCSGMGMRLCMQTELQAGVCCNMGCDLNNVVIWSREMVFGLQTTITSTSTSTSTTHTPPTTTTTTTTTSTTTLTSTTITTTTVAESQRWGVAVCPTNANAPQPIQLETGMITGRLDVACCDGAGNCKAFLSGSCHAATDYAGLEAICNAAWIGTSAPGNNRPCSKNQVLNGNCCGQYCTTNDMRIWTRSDPIYG